MERMPRKTTDEIAELHGAPPSKTRRSTPKRGAQNVLNGSFEEVGRFEEALEPGVVLEVRLERGDAGLRPLLEPLPLEIVGDSVHSFVWHGLIIGAPSALGMSRS